MPNCHSMCASSRREPGVRHSNSAIQVSRTVNAIVKLMPRLPGRTVRAGDVATATDLSVNPANYQATLPYTLTTTASSSTTLQFDPGTLIQGPIWLRGLSLFNSEGWSSTIRTAMLTEIGNEYGSSSASTFVYPHPLNGPLTFTKSPSSSVQSDLGQLKTSWTTTSSSPSIPALNASAWESYSLYNLGPKYQATMLQGSLTNVTLAPSTSNPLGIFVQSGNLTVYGQDVIQGTLIVTGSLTFMGQGTAVTSYDWYGSNGSPVIPGADRWPRLPAIMAQTVEIYNQANVVIEWPVLLSYTLSGGGCDFNYASGTQVNLTGTATATRSQQPYSTVQLIGSPNLSAIAGNLVYAIWLANGTTGRWYQIQSVNNTTKTLTIVGEASITTPVSYKIGLSLTNCASFNGPVAASSVSLNNEEMWSLNSFTWSNAYNNWNSCEFRPPVTVGNLILRLGGESVKHDCFRIHTALSDVAVRTADSADRFAATDDGHQLSGQPPPVYSLRKHWIGCFGIGLSMECRCLARGYLT